MVCDVIGRPVASIGIARLRTDIDGPLQQPIDGPHINRFGFAHAHFAEIEDWNFKRDIEAAILGTLTGCLVSGDFIGVAGVQDIDESCRLGETICLGECVNRHP
ncbi:Uncharacterised protein [Mycobacterium tuberculosis]|nr:Uncharacterised protein [Mycobacterium tuberculosis]